MKIARAKLLDILGIAVCVTIIIYGLVFDIRMFFPAIVISIYLIIKMCKYIYSSNKFPDKGTDI